MGATSGRSQILTRPPVDRSSSQMFSGSVGEAAGARPGTLTSITCAVAGSTNRAPTSAIRLKRKRMHTPREFWLAVRLDQNPACANLNIDAQLPLRPSASTRAIRSEEHTSELQSLMRISYAVFCLKKKQYTKHKHSNQYQPARKPKH